MRLSNFYIQIFSFGSDTSIKSNTQGPCATLKVVFNIRGSFIPCFFFFFFNSLVALDKTRFKVGGYCEVCKTAVTYIDRILEKNATESQIEEAVRKVCSFLPNTMQKEVRTGGLTLASRFWPSCLNPTFVSPVWSAGGTVWASAYPAAGADARPRLRVHGKPQFMSQEIYYYLLKPDSSFVNQVMFFIFDLDMFMNWKWGVCVCFCFRISEPVLDQSPGCWEQRNAPGDPLTGVRTWRLQLCAV